MFCWKTVSICMYHMKSATIIIMIIKKLIPKANYTNKLQDMQYIQTKSVCYELITASFQAIPNEAARPRRRKKNQKRFH